MTGSILFQESTDDGDDVGMGEMIVSYVSSCESVCEGAADALETGGVLVYSAVFHSPLWMSGGNHSLHLQHLQERSSKVLDMLQMSKMNFASWGFTTCTTITASVHRPSDWMKKN